MQGLEDHCLRFTGNQLVNGLPSQLFDERSAWGIEAAVRYYETRQIMTDNNVPRQIPRIVVKADHFSWS